MDFKFSDLAKPFPPEHVEWKAGATNVDKTKALAMAYIDSRAVMNRLDDVVGPQNWKDDYKAGPDGGVLCGISIRFGDEWITKWDGGENSDFEAVKGGLSDAFKRAAVKWGIGRYLYDVPSQWVECEQRGKTTVLKGKPTLPQWALPQAQPKTQSVQTSQPAVVTEPVTTPQNGNGKAPVEKCKLDQAIASISKKRNTTEEKIRKALAFSMESIDQNAPENLVAAWLDLYAEARKREGDNAMTPQEAGHYADMETMKAIDLGAI